MKKLIPALCMLLVAACLMGTSTYAWFAANEDVTASGMQVKAAADGGLMIASWNDVGGVPTKPGDTDFATSDSAAWTNIAADATIKPTSNNAGVWYSAGAANNETHSADMTKGYTTPATRVDMTDMDAYVEYTQDLGAHAQMAIFDIKSMDQTNAAYTLKLNTITVDVPDDAASEVFNQALRIAVYCDGKWSFYAPQYTSAGTTKFYYANGTATPTEFNVTGNQSLNFGTAPANALCTNLTTAGTTVEVYVYYEGEDTNCTTALIRAGVDVLGVSFQFTATKTPTP